MLLVAFEYQKHMFKLMNKNIHNLHSNFKFNLYLDLHVLYYSVLLSHTDLCPKAT